MPATYEFRLITISSDIERDFNREGRNGWHPSTLLPVNTPFGPKILLQRETQVEAYPAEEQKPELLQESAASDLERKFGL